METLYNDKASIVLRKLIQSPGKKWTIREFLKEEGSVSQGWAQKIFSILHEKKYGYWHRHGRNSYFKLTKIEPLIKKWSNHYSFNHNNVQLFFSDDYHIESKINEYLSTNYQFADFALGLFSAARLTHPVWINNNISFYLKPWLYNKIVRDLVFQFKLHRLKSGGNIWLINPYYKESLFCDSRNINDLPVVSDVQIYLDFMCLTGRGPEQAQVYIEKILKNWKKNNE
ncbi:MAG: type IV toxin-antitoxin system AbiEi family antitoxin [bacterium]|nr:hypothetical protein [bacterium]MBU1918857.1 hypothetical protein [bacterium]